MDSRRQTHDDGTFVLPCTCTGRFQRDAGAELPCWQVRADFNCAGARGVSAQSNRLSCSENLTETSLFLPTCWAKSCCDKRTAASCIISTTSSMLVAGS
ncbi:hypothetical protein, variant [Phytophthora nicotianae INRA-310]|uniref:Uncharacterized protein n=1 Tax=Phytophthora nicotianae (strain INRA-310) TaxID=761204 RepID=W2Q063_PHYN3|nr:hypothetical protein, variant [Phytophthora nicotianae INRA-310]ETN05899.1 hypothetical protein, variant [Phytophthora nicotianae INRA-310]